MLSHLIVSNFTLVDRIELEFSRGMTVVTGETGAGKSIMLDAVGLALGDRSDINLIGTGKNKAEIHATFDLKNNQSAQDWLAQRELNTDSQECILRRVIATDGRSRGFINGAPSTINDMKTLGEMLIDIHSQHEHQSLLRKETHIRLLDEYAEATGLSKKVGDLFNEYQNKANELDRMVNSRDEQTSRSQLLTYQFEELEQLQIEPDEHTSLEQEQRELANAETILSNCNAVLQMCQNSDAEGSLSQLSRAAQLLDAIDVESVKPIHGLLTSAIIQIEEAMLDLERFSSDFQVDPIRLADVEERLSVIYDLCRKHQIKPQDIQTLKDKIAGELESLNSIDGNIDSLEREVETLKEAYFTSADKLSATRAKAAVKLRKKVTDQLTKLGMAGAAFEIALIRNNNDQLSARGMESIEFLISTNPGQTPRALNKIASGGELSRISLAIQVVTADTSDIPTLVFDEVDVGIGGGIAEVVGSLLRRLATKTQIICVTHLPQVAAQGHQHLKVTKTSDKKHARTEIEFLDTENKVEEIARMLGGVELTDQSIAHAEEMYKTAQI